MQKTPARQECEQDEQHATQRRRESKRPFRLAEQLHGRRHEIELAHRARVVHATRQQRLAVLDEMHRRHGHRLFIAVQADVAEAPETHARAERQNRDQHRDDQRIPPCDRRGVLEERGEVAQRPRDELASAKVLGAGAAGRGLNEAHGYCCLSDASRRRWPWPAGSAHRARWTVRVRAPSRLLARATRPSARCPCRARGRPRACRGPRR